MKDSIPFTHCADCDTRGPCQSRLKCFAARRQMLQSLPVCICAERGKDNCLRHNTFQNPLEVA